jgi:hypothetical protein
MMRASSSGDHFDCFFAGDWKSVPRDDAPLFVGMVVLAMAGPEPVPTVVAALEGMEVAERAAEAGEVEDRDGASSSSLGFRRSEISTLDVV